MSNKLKSHSRVLLIMMILLAPLRSAVQAQESAGNPRLLLIAVDGLRPDYVLDADRYKLAIPNLRNLVRTGMYATSVKGVIPTVTYPSFTTILTGASPARHGIVANTTFDPMNRNATGWDWYAEDIRVPTLWDVARTAGITTASVHWPVSVGAPVTWNLPQIWRTGMADDRKLLRALATNGLQMELEAAVGSPYADGIDETISGDENRARFTAKLIERHRPGFVTAYFTALDHEQHQSGPFTPKVFATLESIDSIIGMLIDVSRKTSGENVTVAIVSDHGFERTNREVNLLSAFRTAGLITFDSALSDKVKDWRASVWSAGASAAIVLKDRQDAKMRTQVRALLALLAADSTNGIDRVLEAGELQERGGFPDATFLVNLRHGYQIGYATTGPIVGAKSVGGMHGYLPDNPAMSSAFLIAGPGISRGASLGAIDLRDIAPTLASVLRVEIPTAEGRRLMLGVHEATAGSTR